MKKKLHTTYSDLDREVKKRAREDDAEEAAQKQDIITLNKITKSVAGAFKNNVILEQMQRPQKSLVFNRGAPSIHANISENDNERHMDNNPQSLNEN